MLKSQHTPLAQSSSTLQSDVPAGSPGLALSSSSPVALSSSSAASSSSPDTLSSSSPDALSSSSPGGGETGGSHEERSPKRVGGTRWLFVNANWPSRCPLSNLGAVARASGTDDTAAADARPCPSPRSGFVQTALIGPILVPGALARGCPALLLGDRHRPGSRPRTGPRPIDAAVARRGVVLPPGGSAVADRQPDGHRARPDPGTGGPRSVGASRPRVLPVDRPCGARAMRHSLTAVQPQCGKHDASIGFMQTRAAVLEIKNRARRAGPSQGERVKKWGDTSS